MMRRLLLCLLLTVAFTACGDDGPEKSAPCDEGATQACVCSDGAEGTSVCVAGSFGACECGPATCASDDDCGTNQVCGDDSTCLADADGDGVADADDNCPNTSNPMQEDVDMNGTGDACQTAGDSDGDGLNDLEDNCPDIQNPMQEDSDRDGIGNVCDDDRDGDGVPNADDNCPDLSNDRQTDTNGDGLGNACDTDEDGVRDDIDNCRGLFNPDQNDLDEDQAGDACDGDRDGDSVPNESDICPDAADPDQLDTDMDGDGNACDSDDDNDGVSDANDNCPLVANPRQGDGDQNGIGDVCDDPDMDGIPDSEDNCPDEANPQQEVIDTDGDGITDCIERSEGIDPTKADTDDDGLSDLDEFANMTNPNVPDTDSDGLNDGDEIDFGLDPTNPSTFNDGIMDGMRDFVQACASPMPGNSVSYRNTAGDWDLSLPLTFTSYSDLAITTANATNGYAAGVFRNAAGSVAGFVYAEASVQSRDLYAELEQALGASKAYYAHAFVTHEGYDALTFRRFRRSGSQTLEGFRNDVLFDVAGFTATDVTNLPPSGTATGTGVEGHITVINRGNQLVVLGAFTFDLAANEVAVTDAANSTGLSRAMLTGTSECRPFAPVDEFPGTDVYWQIDGTGSMDTTYNNDIKPLWTGFVADLAATNVTARFAMADMADTGNGRPRPTPGWMTTATEMSAEATYWANGSDAANEYGLRNARDGITWLTSPQVSSALAPRAGSDLIYVTITDEESQTFQSATYSNPQVIADIAAYGTFFAQNAPFYAMIPALGSCASGPATAYEEVAMQSGGFFSNFCDTNSFEDFHEELADVITSRGSLYRLSTTPISSSLKVLVGGVEVPRGGPNGWEYFVETNSIVLRGTAVPALNDPAAGTRGDGVAIVYEEAP